MNRRQEIACWVFGLLLAWATARTHPLYIDALEWSLQPAPPIAILGALAIYGLRARDTHANGEARILVVGMIAACLLIGAGELREIAHSMPDTGGLETELDALRAEVADVATNVGSVETAVSSLETAVNSLETAVSLSR